MELPENAQAIAERRAAEDAALMQELTDRARAVSVQREVDEEQLHKERRISHAERVKAAQNAALIESLQMVPLNREQRRAQVKAFAKMLKVASQQGGV